MNEHSALWRTLSPQFIMLVCWIVGKKGSWAPSVIFTPFHVLSQHWPGLLGQKHGFGNGLLNILVRHLELYQYLFMSD